MGFSWVKLVEVKNTSDYPNESQIALNLGMRAADGIILLFANQKTKRDRQELPSLNYLKN